MAVRWSAGEDTLTTCNMDIFPLDTLDETTGLRSGGTLDALHGCLDPTILSIFEDTPATETRDLDHENEATLLTALTEILDNVDDENLSPFDMLPESDLLSGQKGREHSPLRRLFCLSRSPPEKDVIFGKPRSTGKTLPMVLQRSDGEEEEDSLTPSPERLELSFDNELLDQDRLPITFEQHGEDVSVNLGDLVRHMHPYCMAISLEDDKGEQMLPEGGILLEVVDQGENGEPIFAIPEMDHPISLKLVEAMSNPKALDEADDQSSDTSEHIVVDDDDDEVVKPPVKDKENKTCSNVMDTMTRDDHKDNLKCINTSQRKMKFNCLTASSSQPTEGRVLRSASLKRASHKRPKKSEKQLVKEDKNAPQDLDTTNTTSLFTKPKNMKKEQTESFESTTNAGVPLLPMTSKQPKEDVPESPPKAEYIQQSDSVSNFAAPAPEKEECTIAGPTAGVDQSASPELTHATVSVEEPSPPLPPAVIAEPKPKSLSLAEYRRLRQQKKPSPMEKTDDNSTKWPSLPEMPRELLPIPCLPEPSPRDPRRSRPQSKEVEEVKPAWMPRGPCAPPTPEALLAPPAYMVNSNVNKISAAPVPKPQQAVCHVVPFQHSNLQNTSTAVLHKQETTKDGSCAIPNPQTCQIPPTVTTDEIKPAATVLTSTSHNAVVSSETKATLNSIEDLPKSTDSPDCGQGFSSPVNLVKLSNQRTLDESEKSPAETPLLLKDSTQEIIEAFTSELGIEATDLTSLLEQFEETQAIEEQYVPEVSGRAVAVGNSSLDLNSEKSDVERVKATDLSSTALTPPATPPHPVWKPLMPVSLLGKSKTAETKSGLSKVIEIEAQPLPSAKVRSKFTPAAASLAPDMACQDHDYCLPNKGTSSGEAGKRWNVKQNSSITIKPIKQTSTPALQNVQATTVPPTAYSTKMQLFDLKHLKTDDLEDSSVLETPDASPTRDVDNNSRGLKERPSERIYRPNASSRTPSPKRRSVGRSRVRGSRRSPSPRSDPSESDSSRSRSRSYTPPKKRYRLRRSRSSSSSRSPSLSSSQSQSRSRSPPRRRRYSYSSSRSASWSRSRSRSRSPQWSRKRLLRSPSYRDLHGTNVKTNHELKRRKEKAIEERRVVYVGRIRGTMTQKELKERFSYFGEIEECTLHFRDHGDNYGFVTFYNTNDAFMAIENGCKLRQPDELPFDLCFGGRRQFCQTNYADLDSNKEYDPLPSRNQTRALDFDTLLKQAQQNLKR